jgi:hypothetical protein
MIKEKNILMTTPSDLSKDINKIHPHKFGFWGPMLCKIKIEPSDLKKLAKLGSKKASFVNEKLAGVIKHEHYISTQKYAKILEPYLISFRHGYRQWYGTLLTKDITVVSAWVNFMVAGEFNPPHIHSRCDFSSVLFVKVPEKLKEEHKKFEGTGGGPGAISFTYGESQPHSIFHKDFFPEEGDFYIFPATLKHFVCPFMSEEERISISANFKLD